MKLINLKEADISLANGGKINGLIQLKQHNFPVPEGWLINQANTLNNLEETQLASLKSQLTSRLRPETTYIVRSSGALEDGAHVSFAGQYTSVRDCRTFDDIWTGIETCIASATAAHVQNYSQQMKITTTDAEFSVLIQEQLEADVSGIAFSMNPISNHDQEMFVEYVKGSGENLANGRLTPKSLTLSWQQTSFDHIQDLQLSSTLLSTLHQTILKAARLFAYPVDLEFCVVGETLYLVQARPITSIQAKVPQGSWTTANFRDGGVAAQACPALMWSLYRDAWQMSLESFIMDNQLLPSQQIPKLALIKYARPYWNVGVVKAAMSRIPGYNEREFDDELGITKTYVGDGRRSYLTPKTVAQLLRVARKIIRTTQNHQANAETLKENLLNQAIAFEQDIANSRQQQASLESIEQLWQAIVCEGQLACETTYFKQVFINTVQLSMKKTSLLKVMSTETFFQLISKLGHISHLRPTVALEAIAKEISRDSQLKAHWLSNSVSDLTQEWRNNSQCKNMLSITEWLNEFGYHSERELNLQWPSYSEVPEIIIDKILTNITQVSQTTNLQATQSETEIHLRLKAEGFKDRRARALTKDILFLRELLWWREEFKDLSTRYYHLVRQISLLLGTRYQQLGYIESSTDVFYLEKEALQLWMKQQLSPIQLRALIEQNKGYCEAYENYQPMGDLQTGLAQQQSVNLAHDIQLKGIGGNDGIVEAKVRVLTELSQLNELETGEILVTRFTDTGWSHRFGRLAGLITETGGVLSHATIVAREFGLPTIIGAKDATRLLKTGMLIRMNGASGEIQIIKKTGELEGGN